MTLPVNAVQSEKSISKSCGHRLVKLATSAKKYHKY